MNTTSNDTNKQAATAPTPSYLTRLSYTLRNKLSAPVATLAVNPLFDAVLGASDLVPYVQVCRISAQWSGNLQQSVRSSELCMGAWPLPSLS